MSGNSCNQGINTIPAADRFFASGGHRPTNWEQPNQRAASQGANLRADALKYTNWSKKAPNWI